jgi:hypothetical protein
LVSKEEITEELTTVLGECHLEAPLTDENVNEDLA